MRIAVLGTCVGMTTRSRCRCIVNCIGRTQYRNQLAGRAVITQRNDTDTRAASLCIVSDRNRNRATQCDYEVLAVRRSAQGFTGRSIAVVLCEACRKYFFQITGAIARDVAAITADWLGGTPLPLIWEPTSSPRQIHR
jgi:hypothetical protein